MGLRGGQAPQAQFWAGEVSITHAGLAAICICRAWKQFVAAQLLKAFGKVESALRFCGGKTQTLLASLLIGSGAKDHSLPSVTFRQNWKRKAG